MQQASFILSIVAPVLFWAAYHYHKDRQLPEPVGNLLLCFLLGLLSAALAKLLYIGLEPFGLRYDALALADENRLGLFAYAILAIGPIEELAKLLPFLLVVLRFRAFDDAMDGIIYASFIALGYAAAENYHYLDFLTPVESIARGFASPAVHIVFASIWAHWIATAWLEERSMLPALAAGFTSAAALHGIYDFLVLIRPAAALPAAAALIAVLWFWRLRVLRAIDNVTANRQRG